MQFVRVRTCTCKMVHVHDYMYVVHNKCSLYVHCDWNGKGHIFITSTFTLWVTTHVHVDDACIFTSCNMVMTQIHVHV